MEDSITWSDGIGHRGRRSWLLLIKGEKIVSFTGGSVKDFAVVRGSDFHKNGKWSHTKYRIELAAGVRAISGLDGWETGRFAEGLRSAVSGSGNIDTWGQLANALGVSVPSAMSFLREWRPAAATAFDEVDAKLTELDEAAETAEASAETETVVVSFGSPTRRQREEGFWVNPKSILGHKAQIRLIESSKGWEMGNIAVAGMVGTVISATHSSGHGGGYVSVTVAVVPGTESAAEGAVDESNDDIEQAPAPAPEPVTPPVTVIEAPPVIAPPAKPLSAEDIKAQLGKGGFFRRG